MAATPCPSLPALPLPHVTTEPSCSTAAECRLPAERLSTSASAKQTLLSAGNLTSVSAITRILHVQSLDMLLHERYTLHTTQTPCICKCGYCTDRRVYPAALVASPAALVTRRIGPLRSAPCTMDEHERSHVTRCTCRSGCTMQHLAERWHEGIGKKREPHQATTESRRRDRATAFLRVPRPLRQACIAPLDVAKAAQGCS